ncbi:unnamed protein product [Urochloa humidicola]
MEAPRFLSEIFPQDQVDLSWVPDGMDASSAYRLAMRVEGGSRKRTTRCRSCKQLGHMQKTCNEYIYDSDVPPPAAPPPEPPQYQPPLADPLITPSRAITSVSTPSPVTRGYYSFIFFKIVICQFLCFYIYAVCQGGC